MFKILIATKNKGKIKEIKQILADIPVTLIELPESDKEEVAEDGETYLENALKKARHYAEKYRLPALADDSGLEIDFLNGDPGVNSARFLGEGVSFEEKIGEILKRMQGCRTRTARFRATFVLYLPKEKKWLESTGTVEGEILNEIRKKEGSGFGYDPIFKPIGYNESFSELGEEVKNRISHRSIALNQMKEIIQKEFLGGEGMIEIKVNGKRLPANKYVYSVFESVIMALISTLRDVPEIEQVEITLKKSKEEKAE